MSPSPHTRYRLLRPSPYVWRPFWAPLSYQPISEPSTKPVPVLRHCALPAPLSVLEEDDPNTPDLCDMNVDDLLAYAQDVHAYNLRLREDFLAFETMIENVLQRFRPASDL